MDTRRILGVLAAALGAALVVLGGFLKFWYIPEESDGWMPLLAGGALLALGVALLRREDGRYNPQ